MSKLGMYQDGSVTVLYSERIYDGNGNAVGRIPDWTRNVFYDVANKLKTFESGNYGTDNKSRNITLYTFPAWFDYVSDAYQIPGVPDRYIYIYLNAVGYGGARTKGRTVNGIGTVGNAHSSDFDILAGRIEIDVTWVPDGGTDPFGLPTGDVIVYGGGNPTGMLTNIMLHELGHTIGLAHINTNLNAVMDIAADANDTNYNCYDKGALRNMSEYMSTPPCS